MAVTSAPWAVWTNRQIYDVMPAGSRHSVVKHAKVVTLAESNPLSFSFIKDSPSVQEHITEIWKNAFSGTSFHLDGWSMLLEHRISWGLLLHAFDRNCLKNALHEQVARDINPLISDNKNNRTWMVRLEVVAAFFLVIYIDLIWEKLIKLNQVSLAYGITKSGFDIFMDFLGWVTLILAAITAFSCCHQTIKITRELSLLRRERETILESTEIGVGLSQIGLFSSGKLLSSEQAAKPTLPAYI